MHNSQLITDLRMVKNSVRILLCTGYQLDKVLTSITKGLRTLCLVLRILRLHSLNTNCWRSKSDCLQCFLDPFYCFLTYIPVRLTVLIQVHSAHCN